MSTGRPATIHRYIGGSRYFFTRYEYRYLEQDIDICDIYVNVHILITNITNISTNTNKCLELD